MEGEERREGTEERVGRGERLGMRMVPEPDLNLPVPLEGLEDERGVVSISSDENKDRRRRPTAHNGLGDVRGDLGVDALLPVELVAS